MAAPKEGLNSFEESRLKQHVADLVRVHKKETTVDMVADSLLHDEDPDIKRIGHQLYPFTSAGQYGKYFVGKNNIDFKTRSLYLSFPDLKVQNTLNRLSSFS